MNNFFYSSSDYDLFKKALRSTKNEPVVINILSNDSSLKEDSELGVQSNTQRKQMSSKFQASPFDKFFGPRKKRTDPLDMKDFSSWRNKNFRESEKQIDSAPEETNKFSFSDYLNSRTKDKQYNSEDQLKAEAQKSIDQLSSQDEDYKKFSLDSYLNKLEQQTKAKKDFAETDDLVSDFVDEDSMVNSNKDQDENFLSSSNVGVEDIAFGGEIKGEQFAFDREELDSVKARLEKMEREANNIKDKPTTKVISTNELSDIAKSGEEDDDEFNLDKLGIEDDIERVNQKIDSLNKVLDVTGDEKTETPKVEHKRFVEVNKSFEDSETNKTEESLSKSDDSLSSKIEINIDAGSEDSKPAVDFASKNSPNSSVEKSEAENPQNIDININGTGGENTEAGVVKPVVIVGATANPNELNESSGEDTNNFVDGVEMVDMGDENADEVNGVGSNGVTIVSGNGEKQTNEIKKSDEYITKTDLRNVTDEIIGKFSEMSRGNNQQNPDGYVSGEYENPYGVGYDQSNQPYTQQTPLIQPNDDGVSQLYGQSNVVGVASSGQVVDQAYQSKQEELQAQLMQLIEQNKRNDEEVSKKLELAEKEKLQVAEEYENRLRELEESMLKKEEAAKHQAYIEKLKNDIKFKKSENKFKLREEQIRESEKTNSQTLLDCEKLKSELKNSLSVSNLEMDKKLLESVNRLHKAEIVKQGQKVEELEQDLKEEIEKPSKARTSQRRRTSTVKSRMRTRTPRRRIDSDIIGGINFD